MVVILMTQVSIHSSVVLYKRIWAYMSEYWKKFIVSIVAMGVAAATEPLFASLIKPLIDKGFIDKEERAIIFTPVAIIALFLVRGVSSYINETTTTWLSGTVVERMRGDMFKKMLHLPVQYYDDNNSGRITSRIVYDVTQITEAGFNIVTIIFKDGLTILGLLGLLFYTNWKLTLFCFFTLPFVIVIIQVLSKRLRRLSKTNQEQYGQMTQIITEAIGGQKIVKLYNGYDYESGRFYDGVKSIKVNNVKQSATSALNSGLSQFLVALALSMILFMATTQSKDSGFSAGSFMSFLTAMIMIFQPFKRITNVTQSIQRGFASAESVFSFLDVKEEVDNGGTEIGKAKGDIAVKNVTFRYPTSERDVLSNISLEIKSGETVALVGSSGSGKTTLANLIPRFYTPSSGQIILDGVMLQDIKLSSLRNAISFVGQDVVLFNDTVANNIAYGLDSSLSSAEIEQAARLANAYNFIIELPQGFDTLIGEHGTRLSGGQKQRLAIARAILKNSPILILDEATSALDNQSEKLVQQALDGLMVNRTTLVIAHRLSTVINATKIVVMDQGKIVEVGKHDELLARGGIYYNLYKLQFKDE